MSEEELETETATIQAIHGLLAEASDGEALTADGLDLALVGSLEGWYGSSRQVVALYDLARCVEILIDQGMEEEEAIEFVEYNILGAYVGPFTPVFAVFYRQPTITDPSQ